MHPCLAGTGGLLLEAFLASTAPYNVRRSWTSLLGRISGDQKSQTQDQQQDVKRVIKLCRTSFYFHLLSGLASRGTSANRQLFFISLVMRHKGLSRTGLRCLSLMNLGLSPRSFDPELALHEQRCAEQRRFVPVIH